MKYKLGDFVRFVDEKMEGYITSIINDEMIGVTGDDDFEIPVLATKVTSVHGHHTGGGRAEDGSAAKGQSSAAFVPNGVHLAILSDARAASVVHFHLVNETSFELLATLTTQSQDKYKGEFSGIIAPNSTVDMYAAQLADIQLWPTFDLQVLFYTKQQVKPQKPILFSE